MTLFFYLLMSIILLTMNDKDTDNKTLLYPEIMPLSEIIGDIPTTQSVISPDGAWIAWYRRHEGICLYFMVDESINCHEWPPEEGLFMADNTFLNIPSLYWSPDSQKIIFSRNLTPAIPWDSDIWSFDITTGLFNNLTPDGFIGIAGAPDGLDALMDIYPVWQSNQQILFARLHPVDVTETGVNPYRDGWWRDLHIMQLDLNTSNLEAVLELPDQFMSMITMLSVSPDEKTVALSLYEENLSRSVGIWLYDRERLQLEKVFSYADIQSLIPDRYPYLYPQSMIWTQDNNLIVSVGVLRPTLSIDHYINLYFDVDTETLSLISHDLEVFASAYDDVNETLYIYHRAQEREMGMSYVHLNDIDTIYSLRVDNLRQIDLPSGKIHLFSDMNTVILSDAVWLQLP